MLITVHKRCQHTSYLNEFHINKIFSVSMPKKCMIRKWECERQSPCGFLELEGTHNCTDNVAVSSFCPKLVYCRFQDGVTCRSKL